MRKSSEWVFTDSALIIGVTLALFLCLIGLVRMVHRRRRRRRSSAASSPHKATTVKRFVDEDGDGEGEVQEVVRRRKRKRHRRREHRNMNPTLAEIGGAGVPLDKKVDSEE